MILGTVLKSDIAWLANIGMTQSIIMIKIMIAARVIIVVAIMRESPKRCNLSAIGSRAYAIAPPKMKGIKVLPKSQSTIEKITAEIPQYFNCVEIGKAMISFLSLFNLRIVGNLARVDNKFYCIEWPFEWL